MMTSDDSGDGAKSEQTTTAPAPFPGGASNPSDFEFDKNLRIAVLIAEVVLGTVGGVLVCVWLWRNCRRRSRIIAIIMNVTATDLLVICFACIMQLVWELVDRHWMAGDIMCRALKWGQSFTMMSSNYMLVVLSVDRHEAIRSPLKKSISVMKMAAIGYGAAALLSLPQVGVFRQNHVTSTGIFFNKTVCESIFRDLPDWHRKLYLVFISIVVFYLPIVIIAFCYVRIYLKVSQKTADGLAASTQPAAPATASKKASRRPGKVLLQSTRSSSLPKAKTKILKMTVVIVSTFVVFGLPYHFLEMVVSFGHHSLVGPTSMAVFGAMAVANSAVNPYVFLLFNTPGGGCGSCCCSERRKQQQQKQVRQADDTRQSQTDNAAQQTTSCVQFDSRTTGGDAAQASSLSSAERYVMSQVEAAKT